MTLLLQGVHRLDAETYHRDPAPAPSLSSSLARVILNRSPLHAWTDCARLNPDWQPTEKATFDIGRAAHRMVLGAGSEFEVYPPEILAVNGAVSTKAAKEFAEDCRARGVTPIKEDAADKVRNMAAYLDDVLREHYGIAFAPERSEMAAIAEIEGAWCRAMVDSAPEDPAEPLYDLKTTLDAAPEAVMRSIMTYGYDVQAAHYLDTWEAATGEKRKFRFVFVEKDAPHEVAVVELGADTLDIARRKVARAREMWRLCLAQDDWPGYPRGVNTIDLPEFFQSRWMDRETADADYRSTYGHDIVEAVRRWQGPQDFQAA